MEKIKVFWECSICGEMNYMEVPADQYLQYERREGLLQDLFPDLNRMEREFIKTGYCPDCQRLLFGSDYRSKRIKNYTEA